MPDVLFYVLLLVVAAHVSVLIGAVYRRLRRRYEERHHQHRP